MIKMKMKLNSDYKGGIVMFIIVFVIALIELYIVRHYAFFVFKTKSGGKGTAPKNAPKKNVTPGGAGKKYVYKKSKKGAGSSGGGSKDDDDDDDDKDDDDDDDNDDDKDDDDDDDDEDEDEDEKKPAAAPAPVTPAAAVVPVASEAQLITLLTNLCTTAGGTWDTATKCCRNGKSLSILVPVCK